MDKNNNKIVLMNFIPDYCPACGMETNIITGNAFDKYSTEDWKAGASHQCRCGCYWANANTSSLLECADSNDSDLSRNI